MEGSPTVTCGNIYWDQIMWDNMSSEAERLLVATYYYGERKRFNFERYVRIQKDQHHILEVIKKHGHVGIDPR